MSTESVVGNGAGTQATDWRRWLILPVVLCATFMTILDAFIVNVAIPSIQRNLGASFADIQFILAGYSLAYAVGLITGGRLGDIYGRKRMFLFGMAGFTLASVLCGLATGPGVLIAARVLQGLAAALLSPQVLSIIQVTFTPKERAMAFGIFGAVGGLASITGQLGGGVLLRANLFGWDWRPIFLVNLPVGLLAMAAALLLLQESRSESARRLDLGGVVVGTAGLFLLCYPLVRGNAEGWPWWAFASLLLAVPVLWGFASYERWLSARGGVPLVVLGLFRDRAFTVGLFLVVLVYSCISSFFLMLALTLQSGLQFTAFEAGLTYTPLAVAFFVASMTAARLAPRFGRSVLKAGALIMVAGFAWAIVEVRLSGQALSIAGLAGPLVLQGVGEGLVMAPLVTTVLSNIQSRDAGSASGVLATMQQVGGAFGVALIGIVFSGVLGAQAPSAVEQSTAALKQELAAVSLASGQGDVLVERFRECTPAQITSRGARALPANCGDVEAAGPAGDALERARSRVRAQSYGMAFQWGTLYNVLSSLAIFLLLAMLPTRAPEAARGGGAPAGKPA